MIKLIASMSRVNSFLSRWSRLKTQSAKPIAAPKTAVAAITPEFDGDFSMALHPEIARDERQAALRKLFMTDHYRVMDGLDVYVDDYSKPELLSAELLEKLDHARDLLRCDEPEQEAVAMQAIEPEQNK
jgi:hypothetical protein